VPSWGERDETKLFDARNSVETELSYGSKPSSTTLLGLDFLIDLSPGWLRPGWGFSWRPPWIYVGPMQKKAPPKRGLRCVMQRREPEGSRQVSY
jgi:hypothetical protein